MARLTATLLASLSLLPTACLSWQAARTAQSKQHMPSPNRLADPPTSSSRRAILLGSPFLALTTLSTLANAAPPNAVPDLQFTTSPSGLQYADVKSGSTTSPSPSNGQAISIDYVMSTTGARYGSKIYSTQDAGAPYRWTLGDGSTIPGLEEAVKDMTPGGIRRLIIPSKLAYQSTSAGIKEECQDKKGLGPIPPPSSALGEFQRFKNIYCNPDRQYQPDLVLDVKLYGKR